MDFPDYLARLRAVYDACDGQEPELRLNPGATETAIAAAEAALGFAITPDIRQAWRLADGGGEYMPVFLRPGFLTGYDLLSLAEALAQRAEMAERAPCYAGYDRPASDDARIRPGWFHPGWLPFASFGGGTLMLIADHSPGEAGAPGQIIAFTHDPDEIDWVAPDFASLLAGSITEIEADPEEFLGVY